MRKPTIHPFRRVLMRLLALSAATAFHVFAFMLLYNSVGPQIALIAVLPVVTAAWLYRRRVGLLAGLLSLLLNGALLLTLGLSIQDVIVELSVPGSIMLVIVGGIVGRSRELLDQVSAQTQELEREIAERTQVEEALHRAKEEAEAANLAKSDLVSLISHELRAPITTINLSRELLQKQWGETLGETQQRLLETIETNTERMTRLVSDLTDLARLETGQMLLDCRPESLAGLLAEAIRSFGDQFDQKQQALNLELADGLPPVWCDRGRVVQVLINLLSNAHKYSETGQEITIAARPRSESLGSQGCVQVTIADKGMGIPPEDQDWVFQRFFRSERARAENVRGTGLGLSVSRDLVELHGGRIWFESEPGQGTAFHFTIPTINVRR